MLALKLLDVVHVPEIPVFEVLDMLLEVSTLIITFEYTLLLVAIVPLFNIENIVFVTVFVALR